MGKFPRIHNLRIAMKTIPTKPRQILLLASFFATPHAFAATIVADLLYTDQGNGSYLYELTITNNCPEDLLTFDFTDTPAGDSLIGPSLTIRPGFDADYDASAPALGFFGDTEVFASGQGYSGFSFTSSAAPGTAFTMFEGLTDTGFAMGMVNQVAVPEPGVAVLSIISLGLLGTRRRHHA